MGDQKWSQKRNSLSKKTPNELEANKIQNAERMWNLRESRRGSSSTPTIVSNEELGNVSTVNVEVELNTRDEEVFTVNVEEELNTHDIANIEIEGDNENVNKEIHVEIVDK